MTVQFIPHHLVSRYLAQGWTVVDDLKDCHHGEYSVLMQAPGGSANE